MKIIELKENYPLVYKAALKNQKEDSNTLDDKESIGASFTWEKTVEGELFWYCIDEKNFSEAKTLCPYLFEGVESKFEVGKWYKIQTDWYGKFESIHNSGNRVKFSQYITTDKLFFCTSFNLDYSDLINKMVLLTDLSEIQQYLPEGHPDKIIKSKEWVPKVGEYAVMEKAGGWGYSPKNNGCIAVITNVFKHTYSNGLITYTISGEVINPNIKRDIKFIGIPLISSIKELICRKALPHEVPFSKPQEVDNKDTINTEEFLAEAKRRYPVGTKFLSTYQRDKHEVKNLSYAKSTLYGEVIQNSSGGWVYSQGKWAEIIPPTPTQPIWETEDLTGRYFKALIDSPHSTSYKLGDYIKVKCGKGGFTCFRGFSFSNKGRDWAKYGIQLMPIWFDPTNSEGSVFDIHALEAQLLASKYRVERDLKAYTVISKEPGFIWDGEEITPKKHQVNKFPAINIGDFNIKKSKKRRVSLI